MASRFTWICHASTAAMRRGVFPQDEPIEEAETAKAAATAGSIATADRVWHSPLQRARQTADALGLSGTPEPALQECDYGHWAGRSLKEIHAQDPAALQAWLRDPSAAPHGGESFVALIRRVGSWVDAHRHDAGHTVIVTHASVIRAAVVHAIGAPVSSFSRIDIAPLSQTVFSAHDGQWRLTSMGCDLAQG
jgi:broad specificity phosphatase PhoE